MAQRMLSSTKARRTVSTDLPTSAFEYETEC